MNESLQGIWQQLQQLGSPEIADLGPVPLLSVLLVSLASALFITWLYQVFYRSRATGSQIHRAFPLVGISVTAIFVSVQFSLPLSLGLLGALSIVRFRTPIKEPEEIGFILLVIAASLSAATFNLAFLGLILVVAVAALLLLRGRLPWLSPAAGDGMVTVVLPGSGDGLDALLERLGRELPAGEVDSVCHGDDEVSVTYRFRRLTSDRVPALVSSLRDASDGARPSVFFHSTGDV